MAEMGRAAEQAEQAGTGNPGTLIEKAARFYQKALRSARRARAWLKRRQLEDEDLLSQFLLGAANGKLLEALPEDQTRRELQEAGILTPRGEEYFQDCLTAPLLDAEGGLVSLAGCPLAGGDDRLLPSSVTALWNAPGVRNYGELLLATGLLDGLTLHRAGFPHGCAVIGNHLKPADLNLLHDAGVRRLVVVSADPAGTLVQEQLAGFSTRLFSLRVNEFLQKKGMPALVAELDRLMASSPDKGGEGRLEPLEQGFAVSFGRRRYEIRGIEKNARRLKITLKTERFGKLHADTLDLYHAKSRKTLLQDLCCFFEESPAVVENDLVKLIRLCEDYSPETPPGVGGGGMGEQERREAEAFGKSKELLDIIPRDFETCGLVGEEANKLLCYLAAASRRSAEPLSVLILSSSGAGKSTLQDTALLLCPPEEVVKLTSLTGRALFYKGATSLKHKILALEEEAGVKQAAYAIRNLISAGELIIESTIKDLGSGRMTTMQNRVEGPTAVFITTTNPDVDPEMRSRFFVTGVDESREQTRAILESQRRRQTLEGGASASQKAAVIRRHRNFQRLLKNVAVVNPFAGELTYSDDRLQSRRDQPKYLNLIKAVAFLRQMQKTVLNREGREYVEVDRQDLAIADGLAREILGKSLDDLNNVSRDLLAQIERMVEARIAAQRDPQKGTGPQRADIAFTRREIREHTGWPHARVQRYISQLAELEFLIPQTGRNGRRYVYTLAYDGKATPTDTLLLGRQPQPAHQLITTLSAPYQSGKRAEVVDETSIGPKPAHRPTKG